MDPSGTDGGQMVVEDALVEGQVPFVEQLDEPFVLQTVLADGADVGRQPLGVIAAVHTAHEAVQLVAAEAALHDDGRTESLAQRIQQVVHKVFKIACLHEVRHVVDASQLGCHRGTQFG